MSWLKETIGTEKAIVAMCHFPAMPGDPGYDKEKGMDWIVEYVYNDFINLQAGGVDAVMFSNEFSLPYLTNVNTETVACMARIIGEIKPYIKIPFGVNVLWDGKKSLDLAAATGAKFIREILSGVYASDFGLWNTNFGDVSRHAQRIDAGNVKCLFNILPEAAKYLADRNIVEIAKSTVFNCHADALCVSGLTAGSPTDGQIIKLVKEAVPNTVVFANTGCRINTIESQLSVADGAIVGTTFKRDGVFENEVDGARVVAFMDVVKKFRENLVVS